MATVNKKIPTWVDPNWHPGWTGKVKASQASSTSCAYGIDIKEPEKDPITAELEAKAETKKEADRKTRLYLEYVIGLTSDEANEIADRIQDFYEGAEI